MKEPSKLFLAARELVDSANQQQGKVESTPETMGVATHPAKPLSQSEMRLHKQQIKVVPRETNSRP